MIKPIKRIPLALRRHMVALFAVSTAFFANTTLAHDGPHKAGIGIEGPYAMATAPGQAHGAIFIEGIHNDGKEADQLIGARSAVSATVEVHTMVTEGGVMKMREVSGIEIPPKGRVSLARGGKEGYHLMLVNLKAPLKEGDKVKATLVFKKAGDMEIVATVRSMKDSGKGGHDQSGHMKH